MFAGLGAAFSLCGVGTIIAALLLIHNVLAVSVAERRHDFGVLKSLGTRGHKSSSRFARKPPRWESSADLPVCRWATSWPAWPWARFGASCRKCCCRWAALKSASRPDSA